MDEFPPGLWSSCPSEILMMLFELVDFNNLAICLKVCKRWRDVIFKLMDKNKSWKQLVEICVRDSGSSLNNKSMMSFKEIFFRHGLWCEPISADGATLKHQYPVDGVFTSMEVVKDILVVQCESCKYMYDLNIHEQLEKLYDEMIGGLSSPPEMLLTYRNSAFGALCSLRVMSEENVQLYRQSFNIVFVVVSGASHQLHVVEGRFPHPPDSDRGKSKFLCSYYGADPIIDIAVSKKYSYVLLRSGKVLELKYNPFKRLVPSKLSWPTPPATSRAMKIVFDGYIVYTKLGLGPPVVTHGDDKTGHITYPNASCVRSHDDMLFIGYDDGWVELWRFEQIRKGGTLEEPALALHVCDFFPYLKDTRIVSVDVYEAADSRHLLVATTKLVMHLALDRESTSFDIKPVSRRKRTYH